MTETGISEVLQSLIDTLQVGGEELFRIFTEVQFTLAIQNFLFIIAAIIGPAIGLYMGYKSIPKIIETYKVDSYDEGLIKTILLLCGFLAGLFVSLLLVDGVTTLYLAHQYPQYCAAKELINSLVYLS